MSLLTKIRTLRHVRPAPEPDLPDVAHAVAIIMDGNARWARKRGLPIAAGHRAGTKALRRTVEAAIDLGVDSLDGVCVLDGELEPSARRGRAR